MTAEDSPVAPRSAPPPGDASGNDCANDVAKTGDAGASDASDPKSESASAPTSAEDTRTEPSGAVPDDASTPAASDPREAELAALKKERTDLGERLLRTAADFDNFRKRSRREIDEARLRGKDDALRELLPVFDNLERAVRASGDASDAGAVLEGVRMVLKLFEDTTQRMGLIRVPTTGERFDPAVHEAIQQAESSEHAPGTIIAEIAPGYLFGKRLLRAAMVIVARPPTETKQAAPKDADVPDGASDAKPGDEGEDASSGTAADAADAPRAEGTAP